MANALDLVKRFYTASNSSSSASGAKSQVETDTDSFTLTSIISLTSLTNSKSDSVADVASDTTSDSSSDKETSITPSSSLTEEEDYTTTSDMESSTTDPASLYHVSSAYSFSANYSSSSRMPYSSSHTRSPSSSSFAISSTYGALHSSSVISSDIHSPSSLPSLSTSRSETSSSSSKSSSKSTSTNDTDSQETSEATTSEEDTATESESIVYVTETSTESTDTDDDFYTSVYTASETPVQAILTSSSPIPTETFSSDGTSTYYYSQPYIITDSSETFTTTVEMSTVSTYTKGATATSQTSIAPITTDLNFYENSILHLSNGSSNHGLSTNSIAGISVGSILGFSLIALLIYFTFIKKRKNKNLHDEELGGYQTYGSSGSGSGNGGMVSHLKNIRNFRSSSIAPLVPTRQKGLFEVDRPRYVNASNPPIHVPTQSRLSQNNTNNNDTIPTTQYNTFNLQPDEIYDANPFPIPNTSIPPMKTPELVSESAIVKNSQAQEDLSYSTDPVLPVSKRSIIKPQEFKPVPLRQRFMHILYEEDEEEDELNESNPHYDQELSEQMDIIPRSDPRSKQGTNAPAPLPPKPRKNIIINRNENNEVIDTLNSISYSKGKLKGHGTNLGNGDHAISPSSPTSTSASSFSSDSMISFSSDEFDYE